MDKNSVNDITDQELDAKVTSDKVVEGVLADKAWVSLVRLCGCNYVTRITRKGKSIYLSDPQIDRTYRINAVKFDAGDSQYRDGWRIRIYDDKAAKVIESERNWQT